jgi:hypothetical protein
MPSAPSVGSVAGASSNGTSTLTTPAQAVDQNSTVVVQVAMYGSSLSVSSITDTQSGRYSLLASGHNGSVWLFVYRRTNVASSATFTVSVTPSSASVPIEVEVIELRNDGGVDASGTVSTGSSKSVTASVTTGALNDLVLFFACASTPTGTITFGSGQSGFTYPSPPNSVAALGSSQSQPDDGAASSSATLANSVTWVAVGVAVLPGTPWMNVEGKPFLTVSPLGMAQTGLPNAGADFGPDTTGTTTSGVQEAINAVAATGGTVRLLPGTFVMSALQTSPLSFIDPPNILLTSLSGIIILGDVGGSVVLTPNNSSNYSDILMLYKCNDISVIGIRFLGNSTGLGSGSNAGGLAIESCQRVYVADCHFDSFHGSAIVGDWIFDSRFERLTLDTTSGSNSIYRGFDVAFVQNLSVSHSTCSLPGGLGFNVFYNSTSAGSNGSGRTLTKSDTSNQIRLESCNWFGCDKGIVMSDTADCSILDNGVYQNGTAGMVFISNTTLVKPAGNDVEGCQIWGNGGGNSNDSGAQVNTNGNSTVEVRFDDCDFYDNNSIGLAIVNQNNLVRANGCMFRNRYTSNQTTSIGGTGGVLVGVNTGLVAGSLFANCLGFNPQAFAAPMSTMFPTSGTFALNPNPYPCRVYITGTGSGISKYAIKDSSGTSSGTITTSVPVGDWFEVETGGQISLTYTGSPTWKWEGE